MKWSLCLDQAKTEASLFYNCIIAFIPQIKGVIYWCKFGCSSATCCQRAKPNTGHSRLPAWIKAFVSLTALNKRCQFSHSVHIKLRTWKPFSQYKSSWCISKEHLRALHRRTWRNAICWIFFTQRTYMIWIIL